MYSSWRKAKSSYCILCIGCISTKKFRISLDRGRPCRAQNTRGQRREHLQLQSREIRREVVRRHSRWPLFGGCTSPSNWSVFLRPISWWGHTGERPAAKCFWFSRPATGWSNMERCGSGALHRPDISNNFNSKKMFQLVMINTIFLFLIIEWDE